MTTVKPMISLNTSSSIVRDLKVSGNVWSSTFFLKQQNIIKDETVALFGVLGCDLYESKGATVNNINMVLLVAKMCISKVKNIQDCSVTVLWLFLKQKLP